MAVLSVEIYAGRIAYIIDNPGSIGGDTIFVNRLEDRLGYQVDLIDDNDVDTFSNWSGLYDGIVISDQVYSYRLDVLRDTCVGILSMERYTEGTFDLATTTYRPFGHSMKLVNLRALDFVCRVFADTLYPYEYDNQYLYYFGGLAPDAIVPFNTPDWVGHDSACVVLIDSGGELVGGDSAAARRGFCGLFRNPSIIEKYNLWHLFDRLVTWVANDTANSDLPGSACFSGHLEIDACYCERTNQPDDSATYNSEVRFGFDGDELIGFFKLNAPGRKLADGFSCDSLVLKFPVYDMVLSGSPPDTVMDITISAYRIIRSRKWHGPPVNSGGDPYTLDSTWVTRWDVVAGSSPVSWDTLDLRAGADYDITALASYHLQYPQDSIGDTISFAIPGSVYNLWGGDSSLNNGLVMKVSNVSDSLSNVQYLCHGTGDLFASDPMNITAWFSPSQPAENDRIKNLISEGILTSPKFDLIE